MAGTSGIRGTRALPRHFAVCVSKWRNITPIVLAGYVSITPFEALAQENESAPDTATSIIVTADQIRSGYVEKESEVGFGFPAESVRVPQSVQVINRRLIEDIAPSNLSDIVRTVSGVSAARNSIEPFGSFKLRGFTVSQTIVDGIRNTNSLNIQAEGLASIESVEILRGPGGAVYGLSSPGGVINVVSKKPLREFKFEAAASVGNFSHRQIDLDLTGPITSDGALRFRISGGYENRESFVEFVDVERVQIAPSIEWEPVAGLVARYQGDYRRRDGLRYIGLPLEGTLINTNEFVLPRSLFTGEPGQGDTVSESWVHTLSLERQSDGPNVERLYVRFTQTDFDQPSVAAAAFRPDGRTLNRRFNRFVEDQDEIIVGAQIVRSIRVGGFEPVLSAGVDFADWTYNSRFDRGFVGPLDVLNPVYGSSIDDIFVLAESIDKFTQVGGYIQAVVDLKPDITLMLGGRWDRLENETTDISFASSGKSVDSQFSPRAGISWQVAPGIVPYASFSRTFEANPNFGFVRSPDGAPFGPQTGRQWEAGVKLDAVVGLTSTISLFDIELTNVLTPDPADPFFRIPTGKQRSRGFEFINTWEPFENLTVLASYSYTDAFVSADTNVAPGTRLDNVPEHSVRLWGRYAQQIAQGTVGGFTAGFTSDSAVSIGIGSPLTVPGYSVFQAGAFVRRGNIVASIRADNLFDRDYLLRGAFGGNGVVPGDARRVLFTLAFRP